MKRIYLKDHAVQMLEDSGSVSTTIRTTPDSFQSQSYQYVNINDVLPLLDALAGFMQNSNPRPEMLRQWENALDNFKAGK